MVALAVVIIPIQHLQLFLVSLSVLTAYFNHFLGRVGRPERCIFGL